MTASVPQPVTHRGKVGRFTTTWTFDGTRVECEWDPRPPKHRGELKLKQYRRVREEFLEKLAAEVGLRPSQMLVIET